MTNKHTMKEDIVNKKNELDNIEKEIQQKFNFTKKANNNHLKYMVTFPYPYMNGMLHLGHAYTLLSCDFMCRYYDLNGYNTIFPFAFHATGMPIVSSANKLKKALEEVNKDELLDVDKLDKTNQIKIMLSMGIKIEELEKFKNPRYWVTYFSENAKQDLKSLGTCVDFSRSFITTDMNPHYDSFIKWQFNKLNERNIIKFGKKYIIYSPLDQQPCADHDRSIGEGVEPTSHTFVKFPTNIHKLFLLVPFNIAQNINDIKHLLVNDSTEYVQVAYQDEYFICLEETVRNMKYQGFDEIRIIKKVNTYDLLDLVVHSPFHKDINKDDNKKYIINISQKNINCGSGIIPELNNNDFNCRKEDYSKIYEELKNSNKAFRYYEPEEEVISRSGDKCVVALTDQYFINYGNTELTEQVNDYIDNNLVTNGIKNKFLTASDWINEWPTSRSYGLGTKLFDTEYVIDSLSDSTVYMAYYTIAHIIKDIPIKKINNDIWDYIFLDKETKVEDIELLDKLNMMRKEFKYWYSVDLRVSGKDLISNHLTMTLYNHMAIWNDTKFMPKRYYVNGHVLLNGEKMSKNTGNFLTLRESIDKYGADVTRFVLADINSGMDDANFTYKQIETTIGKLHVEMNWIKKMITLIKENEESKDKNIFDEIFEAQINYELCNVMKYFENMDFHNLVKCGFHEMLIHRDQYRTKCESKLVNINYSIMKQYVEIFLLINQPIIPHFVEHVWEYAKDNKVELMRQYPMDIKVDMKKIYMGEKFNDIVSSCRKKLKKRKNCTLKVQIFKSYSQVEQKLIENINKIYDDSKLIDKYILNIMDSNLGKVIKGQIKQFIQYIASLIDKYGVEYIDWINSDCEYEMCTGWLSKIINNDDVKVDVMMINPDDKHMFKNGPSNPIININ